MNEKIKELLSQAGVHYEVMPKDTVYEKFAELIVQECIDAVYDDGQDAEYYQDRIKRRFGVEE
jgi:uncharacterized protein YqgV (UPF0045/DUF77 family)